MTAKSTKFHAPRSVRKSTSPTNSSYLLGQSTTDGIKKPNFRVEALTLDEGIKYAGTFDSQKRNTRVTIYSARITPDETNVPLQLQLQRDINQPNKLFIVIRGEE